MKPPQVRVPADNTPPSVAVPEYRPSERFWPYVGLPEQPTDEELARLDPALADALFGAVQRPFSVSLEFDTFEGPDFERALGIARGAAEYIEVRRSPAGRHRARFHSEDARRLRDLFEIVGRFERTDVLIDDRPVPYARELWMPLVWFLIR